MKFIGPIIPISSFGNQNYYHVRVFLHFRPPVFSAHWPFFSRILCALFCLLVRTQQRFHKKPPRRPCPFFIINTFIFLYARMTLRDLGLTPAMFTSSSASCFSAKKIAWISLLIMTSAMKQICTDLKFGRQRARYLRRFPSSGCRCSWIRHRSVRKTSSNLPGHFRNRKKSTLPLYCLLHCLIEWPKKRMEITILVLLTWTSQRGAHVVRISTRLFLFWSNLNFLIHSF